MFSISLLCKHLFSACKFILSAEIFARRKKITRLTSDKNSATQGKLQKLRNNSPSLVLWWNFRAWRQTQTHTNQRKWIFRLKINIQFHAHWIFHHLGILFMHAKRMFTKRSRKWLRNLNLDGIGKIENIQIKFSICWRKSFFEENDKKFWDGFDETLKSFYHHHHHHHK